MFVNENPIIAVSVVADSFSRAALGYKDFLAKGCYVESVYERWSS